ncbi:MAG: HAMP domain-containing protein [Anaerolineae bacterium]|nr:HAMP domain-containing protein [Anaerolineae bacterium]
MPQAQAVPLISVPLSQDAILLAVPDLYALDVVLSPLFSQGNKRACLVSRQKQLLHCFDHPLQDVTGLYVETSVIAQVEQGQDGSGFYEDALGVPVIGAYRWIDKWELALIVEQPQAAAMSREEDLATMLIASTLGVALLTTILAAIITRQLTQPIAELAISAVKIAGGDLSQVVHVRRRDEIGILGQAFNLMTAELRSLYEGLEQKVTERTAQLTEANRRLRYQAMQLTLSSEIGRVATSILDLDQLLKRVNNLILESYAHVYETTYAAIFTQDEFSEWCDLQTSEGSGPYDGLRGVAVGGNTLVGWAAQSGECQIKDIGPEGELKEVALPLRIGQRVIGVLDLVGSFREEMFGHDLTALESLGDQISVAIENARAYAAERETVQRLSRLDHVRLNSLSAGSRELATALNNIIGFSGLLIKGVDGPVNEMQRADMIAIHKSGYQLLGLFDNVITLSELESGVIELDLHPVDVVELIEEALAMSQQRFIEVPLVWQNGRPSGLPRLQADVTLLRQAFLGLIAFAVEQIPEGGVGVEALIPACAPQSLAISIGSADWRERESWICEHWGHFQPNIDESSVILALSRDIVILHHGKLWMDFDLDYGWCATMALPVGDAPLSMEL